MSDDFGVGPVPAPSEPPWSDGRAPDLAARIDAARRDATMEGRLAAVSLTLFPVVLATLLLAFDASTGATVRGGLGVAMLVAAAVLTAAGARWLWRIAAPPFAAFPQQRSILERQPQTAYELSMILEQAASYAEDGVDVADALDRAAPEQTSHPSRVLARGLRVLLETGGEEQADEDDRSERDRKDPQADGDEPDAHDASGLDAGTSRAAADEARSELPDWLVTTLHPGWTASDPVETLRLVAVRIRAELQAAAREWPGRVRIAALVPFAVCILPAAVLLALLAFL